MRDGLRCISVSISETIIPYSSLQVRRNLEIMFFFVADIYLAWECTPTNTTGSELLSTLTKEGVRKALCNRTACIERILSVRFIEVFKIIYMHFKRKLLIFAEFLWLCIASECQYENLFSIAHLNKFRNLILKKPFCSFASFV